MTGCSFGCGYHSTGQDLADHQRYEHSRCAECGAEPPDPVQAVTHNQGCLRLQPGYVYPAGPPDDLLAPFLAGFSEVRLTGTPQQLAEALDAARLAGGAERAAQGVHCVSVVHGDPESPDDEALIFGKLRALADECQGSLIARTVGGNDYTTFFFTGPDAEQAAGAFLAKAKQIARRWWNVTPTAEPIFD